MNKVNLYTIYDRVSRVSSSPFTAYSHNDAYMQHVSTFQRSLEKNKNLNFEDFELHYIGSYNPHYVSQSDREIISDHLFSSMRCDFDENIDFFESYRDVDGYITIDIDYLNAIDNQRLRISREKDSNGTGPLSRKEMIYKDKLKV